MSIRSALEQLVCPGWRQAEARVQALEQELEEAREQAHQARQILDLLTQERIFICDMSPSSATDKGNKLYYMNKLGKTTLAEWAPELKQAYGVEANRLLGASIHTFHKNPERIRQILHGLQPGESRHNADIPVGSHILRSVSHALTNLRGEVVGIVATWIDVTDQMRFQNLIEREITQVATAMEEMSATVGEIARSAQHASTQSAEVTDHVTEGERVNGELVAGMDELAVTIGETAAVVKNLGEASAEIDQIVQVIDDIADQTNLLALNAAIEAARAGDQGRGFAVVADEVRKLAERTVKATKEISDTISRNQEETTKAVSAIHSGKERMEREMDRVRAVTGALKTIAESTRHVVDLTHRIATATEEQAATVAEVARSVNLIHQGRSEEAVEALAARRQAAGRSAR